MRWLSFLMNDEYGIDALDLDLVDSSSLTDAEKDIIGMDRNESDDRVLSEIDMGLPKQIVAARIERFCGRLIGLDNRESSKYNVLDAR